MEYVELLRARRVLMWLGGAYLLFFAASVYLRLSGHMHVGNDGGSSSASEVVGVCAGAAWVVATWMATGLLHECSTLPFTWTRPSSRTAIAWSYVRVDVATIVTAALLALITIYLCAAVAGVAQYLIFDGPALQKVVMGILSGLMWYALVILVGSRLPGRAGLVAGLSWAFFLLLSSFAAAPLPQPFHAVFATLDYVNPLLWYSGGPTQHIGIQVNGTSADTVTSSTVALPFTVRALGALAIAAVALPAGIRLWATREA